MSFLERVMLCTVPADSKGSTQEGLQLIYPLCYLKMPTVDPDLWTQRTMHSRVLCAGNWDLPSQVGNDGVLMPESFRLVESYQSHKGSGGKAVILVLWRAESWGREQAAGYAHLWWFPPCPFWRICTRSTAGRLDECEWKKACSEWQTERSLLSLRVILLLHTSMQVMSLWVPVSTSPRSVLER